MSFSSDMVLDRIQKLGADKVVGPDNISGHMLKMCADSIAAVLARIFNISIASGKLPMEWKTAHVVPVYKKRGSLYIDQLHTNCFNIHCCKNA